MFNMDLHPSILMEKRNLQCVIFNKVLSNDSMKPTKLKQHLENVYCQHKSKDKSFFERNMNMLKKMKLGATGVFQETNHKITEVSYVVALEIAKQKKPHTIGKTLIKPCAPFKMVKIIMGNGLEKKLASIPLSDNSIQRQIDDMAIDIKNQVIQEIKSAAFGLFSIQLDESTDVASYAQLLVFARYVYSGVFKEEFLFCSPLATTTKATDILEKVVSFFETENLS